MLLSVFLPMLLFSSLHIHERVASVQDCTECVNHVPHGGHLSLDTTSIHDCLLCQLASLPFVLAAGIAVLPFDVVCSAIVSQRPSAVFAVVGRLQSPRAPPVS